MISWCTLSESCIIEVLHFFLIVCGFSCNFQWSPTTSEIHPFSKAETAESAQLDDAREAGEGRVPKYLRLSCILKPGSAQATSRCCFFFWQKGWWTLWRWSFTNGVAKDVPNNHLKFSFRTLKSKIFKNLQVPVPPKRPRPQPRKEPRRLPLSWLEVTGKGLLSNKRNH